jgi:hypothetical protein
MLRKSLGLEKNITFFQCFDTIIETVKTGLTGTYPAFNFRKY